jgi:sugar/nucleoside kinase (ribokinase family)
MKRYDILVAGEINPDLILSDLNLKVGFGQQETLVERADLAMGSSSAIFACGAARLGLKVGFVGVCGDDLLGHFMLDAMTARGIDVSPILVDPARQTGLSVILARGTDRAILTHAGAIADLQAEQVVDELLNEARHLHVASYFLQTNLRPGLADLFERAHSYGLSTSLDTNWDPTSRWESLEDLLSRTDVFLPNENEALAITHQREVGKAIQGLGKLSQTVAVKLGARGGMAVQSNEIVQAPSLEGIVVDTVGAGDSFDAGFIYGYLNRWDLKKSLQLACTCGALSTQAAGGTDGQPTLEQALAYVEKPS